MTANELDYIQRLKIALPFWICYERNNVIFAAFMSEIVAREFYESMNKEEFYIQDTITNSKLKKEYGGESNA